MQIVLVIFLTVLLILLLWSLYSLNKKSNDIQLLSKTNQELSSALQSLKQEKYTLTLQITSLELKLKELVEIKTESTVQKNASEELELILKEKEKIESEKKKVDEKVKKLWQTSLAVHKEKEKINEIKLEIEQKHNEIVDSVQYAKRIQRALLTSESYFKKYLPDSFILFRPKDIVSGDFYWGFNAEYPVVGENDKTTQKFIITAADCTGHGVPGAFMSMLGINFLNEIVVERKIFQPDLVLNNLRNSIISVLNPPGSDIESKDGMDCVLIAVNYQMMKIEYAAAYNGLYVLRHNNIIHLEADKMPVGKHFYESKPFTLRTFDCQKGDIIYAFTDGYADQFGGPKGKKLKNKKLEEILISIASLPMQEQSEMLEKKFIEWKGELEQVDDICVIGFRL